MIGPVRLSYQEFAANTRLLALEVDRGCADATRMTLTLRSPASGIEIIVSGIPSDDEVAAILGPFLEPEFAVMVGSFAVGTALFSDGGKRLSMADGLREVAWSWHGEIPDAWRAVDECAQRLLHSPTTRALMARASRLKESRRKYWREEFDAPPLARKTGGSDRKAASAATDDLVNIIFDDPHVSPQDVRSFLDGIWKLLWSEEVAGKAPGSFPLASEVAGIEHRCHAEVECALAAILLGGQRPRLPQPIHRFVVDRILFAMDICDVLDGIGGPVQIAMRTREAPAEFAHWLTTQVWQRFEDGALRTHRDVSRRDW